MYVAHLVSYYEIHSNHTMLKHTQCVNHNVTTLILQLFNGVLAPLSLPLLTYVTFASSGNAYEKLSAIKIEVFLTGF
jgi:hypothetical protein